MLNALTVDLEDWYHVCGGGRHTDPRVWDEYEDRVTRNTDKILRMLSAYSCKATFFVLGYIAERNPELVKRIHDEGHEIAVHGYYHKRVFEMTPAEFEDDLLMSISAVKSITHENVLGFRAPEWSIRDNAQWAFPIIRKAGLRYDSSTVPLTRMGDRSYKKTPHKIDTPYGELYEFPLTTFKLFWENLPYTGGLPMRVAPYFFICSSIKKLNGMGIPAISYIHPWEFDKDQPEIELPISRRFMHYFNIQATRPKIEGLLKQFRFAPVKDVLGLNV